MKRIGWAIEFLKKNGGPYKKVRWVSGAWGPLVCKFKGEAREQAEHGMKDGLPCRVVPVFVK